MSERLPEETEVQFGELPPKQYPNRKGTYGRLATNIVAQLQEHPGEWGKVWSTEKYTQANQLVQTLRKMPGVDASQRRYSDPDHYDVWAVYTPPEPEE
jgi:hypothetical protein